MKPRLAWLADAEDADSYSARETRVLLRAIARRQVLVPLWFAVGSSEPPHLWNGIRVFPVPADCLASADFLEKLLHQQRPHVVVSNLPSTTFPAGLRCLGQNGTIWIHRLNPEDAQSERTGKSHDVRSSLSRLEGERPADAAAPLVGSFDAGIGAYCGHEPGGVRCPGFSLLPRPDTLKGGQQTERLMESLPKPSVLLVGEDGASAQFGNSAFMPYLRGLHPAIRDGDEPWAVLERLQKIIADNAAIDQLAHVRHPTHLVMRQQLFCNVSLAHVMFELTNALIELGVPAVPQDEHALLSKDFIHREEDRFRAGAPEKYERIVKSLRGDYDPENAITVHFPMLKFGTGYARFGVFPSLGRREVLYTTGNHAATPDGVRQMMSRFEMILAPSQHTLRPYLEAGLSRGRGAVIPHGVDPMVFAPDSPPFPYTTGKRFKFLQTSFPWIYEKGFDLTIKAFGRAFSNRDDVALILRVPHIENPSERSSSFSRLEALVKEESARAGAPEIVLLELDIELNRRGGIYTGAECYLHPLRAEGFGMTILEAMACGLPVIATPWSGPADFLSPRYTYTLRHSNPVAEKAKDGSVKRYHVEPDLDHLVYLMRYVYEHRDEARALGQRASAIARRDWTWKQAAVKLASVFHLL